MIYLASSVVAILLAAITAVDNSAVVVGSPIPTEWQSAVNNADMFYTDDDANVDRNNMPMIGNGMVALQIGNDEMYIAGVFNNYTHYSTSSHRAVIPTGLAAIAVKPPGISSDAALDVRNARYLRRSYIDPSSSSSCTSNSIASCTNSVDRIVVEQRFYAHRSIPSVLVMEVEVISGGESSDPTLPYAMLFLENSSPNTYTIEVNFTAADLSPDDASLYSAYFGWTQIPESHPYCPPPCNSADVQEMEKEEKKTVDSSTSTTSTPDFSGLTAVGLLASKIGMVEVSRINQVKYFFTIVRTSIETPAGNIVSSLQADFAKVTSMAADGTLFETHARDWADNVWISGYETDRLDVARAVNTSIYAIISSFREDRPFSLSPGGLTQGYNGHTFWDCETWMYPPILFLYPSLAASLLQYRFNRLDGAREKAKSYSPPYSGVMFPWESAYSGGETCPYFAGTGLREIHISGDVSFAVWQYWRSTKDLSTGWLREVAWPILSGVADFWVSKTQVDNPAADPGVPLHILDVIPPDEYADHVSDSIYTNVVAILSLQYAVEAAKLLGLEEEYKESIATWTDVSERIVCISGENANGVWHPEYQGYESSTTVKQADVIMLGYPLNINFANMTEESRVNDLEIYEAVSDFNGPAMTWGMFAMGYIEMGESRKVDAARNYNRSFGNVHSPFNVWTESPDGGANNFLTGAGGFLQAAFFGYTQLRVGDDSMSLKPSLPELTNVVKLRGFAYLGNVLDLQYDAAKLSIEVRSSGSSSTSSSSSSMKASVGLRYPLEIVDGDGNSYKLEAGAKIELPYIQGSSTFTIKIYDVAPSDDGSNDEAPSSSSWDALSVTEKSIIITSVVAILLAALYSIKKKGGCNFGEGESRSRVRIGESKKTPLIRTQDTLYSIVEQGESDN